MISKIYLLILLFFLSFVKAQENMDLLSIFKMQLYLDKNDELSSCTKNDSLYFVFKKNMILKLDTLKKRGNYDLIESVFAPKIEFYAINLSFNKNKNLDDVKKMTKKEANCLGIFSGTFDKYILAIDNKTRRSYRIVGFNSNDFLSFLSDYLEYYNEHNDKKLTSNSFLKNYYVEGIDFKCLYNGLHSDEIDRKKYPCLQRVNDPILIR
ncbi:hypothetical protein SAMN05421786_109178 [Chryseobacterium ureilyticum]|uniref:Uncharacterized protein n=2 Tax=Chryseobacterium TaxID=59732 RepID=A0A1N7QG81_9FLAO|nr:hypothetical protein [Chryseobacterium ureilyticum]SIT21873.1 hypothetical protein SAMN05421786_109178 [Chryseobacterium ureilyticum]